MENILSEEYKGWTISLTNKVNHCSNFSFDISSKDGETQHHVVMGGHTADDARKKAKEMIDMEINFLEND